MNIIVQNYIIEHLDLLVLTFHLVILFNQHHLIVLSFYPHQFSQIIEVNSIALK